MSELNMGGSPTPAPSTPAPAAPAPAPTPAPAAPAVTSTPSGAKVVSEREAVKDANASPESYTDKGRLTTEVWKEKAKKFKDAKGNAAKKPNRPLASDEANGVVPQAKAPAITQESAEPPVEEVQEQIQEAVPGEEGETPATEVEPFSFEPKFTAVGKEYQIPAFMAEAIKTPEQLQAVKDLYTKATGLEHTKLRHQELQDRYGGLEREHNDVVEGVSDLKEIYQEAVKTQNPLLLNDFFEKLQIPPQVILQYAESMRQFFEMDPAQRQNVQQALEAHRRARESGKQNQKLTQGTFQANISARVMELDTALARPEISTPVQKFETQYGQGSFKQELIRNGIYVHKTEGRDLSVAENVNQVLQRFGLQGGAPGNPVPAPQVPGTVAQPVPTPVVAAPKAAGTPVIPAPQPHRKVSVIPTVNGKSSSPAKQRPTSIEDLNNIRKAKYGK